mgnify:CR=1 FL=1
MPAVTKTARSAPTSSTGSGRPDPRINAWRDDLADIAFEGVVDVHLVVLLDPAHVEHGAVEGAAQRAEHGVGERRGGPLDREGPEQAR